jgi:hypothetical protein
MHSMAHCHGQAVPDGFSWASALRGRNPETRHEPQIHHMDAQDTAVGPRETYRLDQHAAYQRPEQLASGIIQHVQGQGVDEAPGPDEIQDGCAP